MGEFADVVSGGHLSWDGAHWESVASAGPGPRVHHAMQYDPSSQRVVLFGGYEPNVRDHGDTWEWNGTDWTEVPPEASARTHGRMAFDGHLGALVLVGGGQAADPNLVRRNDGWHTLGATGPSARYLPGVAFDQRRGVLVLFGGGDPSSNTLFADTWEFDGLLDPSLRKWLGPESNREPTDYETVALTD